MGTHDLESRVGKLEKMLSTFSQELRLALRYVQPDAASSLTKSRVVLEKLLIGVYTLEMVQQPRKPLLGEMLADNQFTRKIERRILSRMNAIRDMGNLGPHGEPVESSDAARVLDDLCEVLDWYLRRYAENKAAVPEAADNAYNDLPDPTDASNAGIRVDTVSNETEVNRHPVIDSGLQLRIISGPMSGKVFLLNRTRLVIGRASTCDIVLRHELCCSRTACDMEWDFGRREFTVRSMTRTPVLVNDRASLEAVSLAHGDYFRVGGTVMRLERVGQETIPDSYSKGDRQDS